MFELKNLSLSWLWENWSKLKIEQLRKLIENLWVFLVPINQTIKFLYFSSCQCIVNLSKHITVKLDNLSISCTKNKNIFLCIYKDFILFCSSLFKNKIFFIIIYMRLGNLYLNSSRVRIDRIKSPINTMQVFNYLFWFRLFQLPNKLEHFRGN